MERSEFQAGKTVRKIVLATLILGGALMLGGATSAEAHNREQCGRRIERAEWKLDEAIQRHGYYSPQADHRRHELWEARERCWRQNREWSEHHRRWREDRNDDDD